MKNFDPKAKIEDNLITFIPLLKDFWTVDKLEEFVIIVLKANPKIPASLTTYSYLCDVILKQEQIIVTRENGEKINLSKQYTDNINSFKNAAFGVIGRKEKIIIEFKSKRLGSIFHPEDSVTIDPETGEKRLNLQIHWSKKIFLGSRIINGECYYYLMTTIGQLHSFKWGVPKRFKSLL